MKKSSLLALTALLLVAQAAGNPPVLRKTAFAQSAAPVASAAQGGWNVEAREGGFLWASTKGDRGSLGQYCNAEAGACAWMLVLQGATCAEGEQYPVLVNTDPAASNHLIMCLGAVEGMGAAFAFVDFDRFDLAIRRARVIGIALPEHDDEIGVARFGLAGAVAAIDRMRESIVARAQIGPERARPGSARK